MWRWIKYVQHHDIIEKQHVHTCIALVCHEHCDWKAKKVRYEVLS